MTPSAQSAGSIKASHSSADVKALWQISLPGKAPFAMVGEKLTYAQALETARRIWPLAELE